MQRDVTIREKRPLCQEIRKYGDAGIIFLSVEDPYSRLIRSISKCEYSAIGFYASSTSTGVLKIIVTLVDLFGVEKPTWLSSGCTLDRLVNNPLVTRLAIKPLSHNTKPAQSKFRACICRGSEMVKKPSLQDTIFSLFGYYPDGISRTCVTGIDLVNQVITLYGAMDKIQPGSTMSLSALDELHKSKEHFDYLSVIGMMGLPFVNGEENVDISSYIVDTNLFGKLVEIPLPTHEHLVLEEEKRKALELYRPYLIKGLSTFVDLLLTHPDFFACVTKRLKAGQKLAQNSEKIMLETLLNFSETSEEILGFLASLDSKEVEKIRSRLSKDYFTTCLFLNKQPQYHTSDMYDNKCTTLDELKEWTQHLVASVETNASQCHPVKVDMTSLISIVNRLTDADISVPAIKKTPSFLDWSRDTSSSCPLTSGKVIYLDRHKPQLEMLSSCDLIEIAKHLNSLDESYDCLRESVADQLTSLHDIEEI